MVEGRPGAYAHDGIEIGGRHGLDHGSAVQGTAQRDLLVDLHGGVDREDALAEDNDVSDGGLLVALAEMAMAGDIGAALEDLLVTQPVPMRILICGSLYLAGEVLVRNG